MLETLKRYREPGAIVPRIHDHGSRARRDQYRIGRLGDDLERGQIRGTDRDVEAREIAGQLRLGHGAGQHDVGPRLRERRGERDGIDGRAETVGRRAHGRDGRIRTARSQPPVRDPFLDDDAPPEAAGLAERRAR